MAAPACLVTSTPDFSPPDPTAPFLIPYTASPDPRVVYVIDRAQLAQAQTVEFNAQVISEDCGMPVRFRLYIDYGFPDNLDPRKPPFRIPLGGIQELPPSTITDTSRPAVRALWVPNSRDPGNGCHNVTLIASHSFDEATDCPVFKSDSSQLTWPVYLCDEAHGFPCKPDFSACLTWNSTCPNTTVPDAGADARLQCGVSP